MMAVAFIGQVAVWGVASFTRKCSLFGSLDLWLIIAEMNVLSLRVLVKAMGGDCT